MRNIIMALKLWTQYDGLEWVSVTCSSSPMWLLLTFTRHAKDMIKLKFLKVKNFYFRRFSAMYA